MIWVFKKSPDKSQISYFLLCNYIDLFIPVAILESDRLFYHAQSHQLAGDKGHTIWPGMRWEHRVRGSLGGISGKDSKECDDSDYVDDGGDLELTKDFVEGTE